MPAKEPQFYIHNTSKSVLTRTQRVGTPGNPKTTLLLAGGSVRVLRGRPTPVRANVLRRLVPELLPLEVRGFAKVLDDKGARIDLKTLKPAPVEEKVVEEPPPPAGDEDSSADATQTEVPAVEETQVSAPEETPEVPAVEETAPTEESEPAVAEDAPEETPASEDEEPTPAEPVTTDASQPSRKKKSKRGGR